MKVRTIAMLLTLLVAGLVIGCSSAPAAPAAPAAPVANLTEKEAIAIARSAPSRCWFIKAYVSPGQGDITSNFSHTESATFKPSGIWVVTAKSSWDYKNPTTNSSGTSENPCTIVVDDATGRVTLK